MRMSRISMGILIALAVVGLAVIVMAAGRIVMGQAQAPAPAAAAPAPMPAGAGAAPAAVALTPSNLLFGEIIRSVMPAVISLVMLIPSSVIVVSRSRPAEHQRWATAAISSIITYWLR
jgi:hypothetical protein